MTEAMEPSKDAPLYRHLGDGFYYVRTKVGLMALSHDIDPAQAFHPSHEHLHGEFPLIIRLDASEHLRYMAWTPQEFDGFMSNLAVTAHAALNDLRLRSLITSEEAIGFVQARAVPDQLLPTFDTKDP